MLKSINLACHAIGAVLRLTPQKSYHCREEMPQYIISTFIKRKASLYIQVTLNTVIVHEYPYPESLANGTRNKTRQSECNCI